MKIEQDIKQTKFINKYQKLAINIMITSNWLTEAAFSFLKPFELTPKQYNVLGILRSQYPEPITTIEIRVRMLDKMSDVSRIVERLRLKVLLKRKTCQQNRRAVDIVITAKGLNLLKKIDSLDDKMESKMTNIRISEAEQVNQILDRIRS